ncbi:MAG: NDP-sugar pyrophosphorylase family protein [Candidatus Paceibacteria bacterium]|jgi:NDP-sugar pyrophosphorylase family protein
MKAVILAGGKGTRMESLTTFVPKPLLQYKGKSLLRHKLEVIPKYTTEIIIVIGYIGEKIKEELGNEYLGTPIRYVLQKELLGTAHALFKCKEHLKEDFIVLMGDDIYHKDDIDKLCRNNKWSVLVEQNDESTLDEEGTYKILNGLLNGFTYTGACYLTSEVFDLEMVSIGKEYGLPQTLSKRSDKIEVIISEDWIRITDPEDLE